MTDTNIKMFRMVHGKYINYTYILSDKENKSVIIDPSWNLEKILRYLEEKSLQLESILLTHSHIDHTNLVEQLVNLFDVDIYISKVEVDYYHCDYPNLQVINDGELLLFGNLKVKCILSPGHTKGSTSYLCSNNLFTGDTIFIEGCGYCKGNGGSSLDMYHTVKKIKRLDFETLVWPGHAYKSMPGKTLEYLFDNNIYFIIDKEEDFIKFSDRREYSSLFKFI